MNIEHRLQHAARDLREVPIVVPPLGHRAGARPVPSRLSVLATPVLVPLLFVAGALFAIGAARAPVHQPIQSDIPAIVGPVTDDEAPAGTSELADEPPARPQRPADTGDHLLRCAHPVQRRIGEDRVELAVEVERLAVDHPRIEAARPGGGDHLRRLVDADDVATHRHQLLRQNAVAAAEAENALDRLGLQEVDDGHAERRDEIRVLLVTPRLPVLCCPAHWFDDPLE